MAGPDAPQVRVGQLEAAGVDVIRLSNQAGGDPVGVALEALGERDIQSLLLEGGPILAEAFLARDAVDRVAWFVAPMLIGGAQAPGALGGRGLGPLAEVPRLHDISVERVGNDVLIAGRLRQLPEPTG